MCMCMCVCECVPVNGMFQMAISPSDMWESNQIMTTCTSELCVQSSDKKTLFFHKVMPTGAIKYALNYIGVYSITI